MNAQSKVREYASLSFSPATADALEATNALASQLRSVPEHLLTEELRSDRARVLNVSLARLLDAHWDARRAGTAGADSELEAGLEHIREELERILKTCQGRARDTLVTEGNYLEQRYPVNQDLQLSPEVVAQETSPAAARALPVAAVEGLFAGDLPTQGEAKSMVADLIRDPRIWIVTALIVLLLVHIGVLALRQYGSEPDEVYQSKYVDVVPVVDDVRRETIIQGGDSHIEMPSVIVELHGTVRNGSKERLTRSFVEVELLECPYRDSALSECTVSNSQLVNTVGSGGLKPNETARWKDSAVLTIGDKSRHLKARITPERSTFHTD